MTQIQSQASSGAADYVESHINSQKPKPANLPMNRSRINLSLITFGVAGMLIVAFAFLFDVWGALTAFVNKYAAYQVDKFLMAGFIAILATFFYLLFRKNELSEALKESRQELNNIKANDLELREMMSNQERVHEDLIARQELTNRLVKLTRTTREAVSLNSALDNILQNTREVTAAELGSLFLLDAAGRVTDSMISRRKVDTQQAKKLTGQVMRDGLAGWVVKNRQAVLLHDAEKDDRWIQIPGAKYKAGSVMGVPITIESVVVGVLTLIHSDKYHFSDDDLELMENAASQMALTLRNAQIFEEQRRMVEHQTSLYQILQAVSNQLSVDGVAEQVVQNAAELTGWSMVTFLIEDSLQSALIVRNTSGDIYPSAGYEIPLESDHAAAVAYRERKTTVLDNLHQNPDHLAAHQELQSELFVPLYLGKDQFGVLLFGDSAPFRFTHDERNLGVSISEASSLALSNAQLFETVSSQRGRLEALIEATSDGIIFVERRSQNVLVINQRAIDMLRIEGTPADFERQSIHFLRTELHKISASAAESFEREIYRLQTNNELESEDEFEVKMASIQTNYLPVLSGGTSIGRLFVLHDVTEERAVNRLRQDLTYTMVHDLRNPLHMITSGLNLLDNILSEQYELGENERQLLHISTANSDKMLGIVNSILEISQLESGNIPLNQKAVDLERIVKRTFKMLDPLSNEKSIELKLDISSEARLAWADGDILERVLQNLVGNALKFTPENGTVSVRTARLEDGKICVHVRDTGTGIPANIKERVFEKFARGNQQSKGSGLGLAFCQMAIEAHGENIWVEETDESGTIFAFTLPAIAVETPTAQPEPHLD